MANESTTEFPYLHGFSAQEQQRLHKQARFAEFSVHQDINFSKVQKLLEVGCGVGAQSEILLRRFPDLQLTGIDLSEQQLQAARSFLAQQPLAKGRYQLHSMDAGQMKFADKSFDGGFLCWILEHVPDPLKILREVKRVLQPGSAMYVTEVMNSSFFLDPYSPNTWRYWMEFNDYQLEMGGDPFVGAKLGNFLMQAGFSDIETKVKPWHLDNRSPAARKEMLEYWTELMLSASDQLIASGRVTADIVEGVKAEMDIVAKDPNAVFFYSYVQATARA